jgi:hypothetical protein
MWSAALLVVGASLVGGWFVWRDLNLAGQLRVQQETKVKAYSVVTPKGDLPPSWEISRWPSMNKGDPHPYFYEPIPRDW